MSNYRNWVFTSFHVHEPRLINEFKFLAFGLEKCPTTGRAHWQGFVCLKNAKSKNSFNKLIAKACGGNCWNEKMKGNLLQNKDYCSKEGKYTKLGVEPKQGKRNDLLEIRDDINNGKTVNEICEENPIVYHQYGRTLNKLEDLSMRKKWRNFMTKCVWVWGETGTGKSHYAFKDFNPDTHYLWTNDNGWWDAYTQQETVIMNDYRGEISYNELLQIIDKWPYNVKRRGREPIPFLSKNVIITSSLPPEKIYKNRRCEDNLDQLLRRIEVVKLE